MHLTPSDTIRLSQDDTPETLIEKAAHVIPSPRQKTWQALELTAFIHFGINTFTGREWGTGMEDPTLFNPTDLDARQWVQALKDAGFKQVVLTAKHHDGFCLWPSRCTDFSVARSPWQNGQGNVLREMVNAAAEAGIKVGFYLSPADLHEMEAPGGRYGNGSPAVPSIIPTPVPGDTRQPQQTFTFTVDDYNRYYLNQLYELLTGYGPVHEIWFDGANPKPGVLESYQYADWFALVRALAPEAVMFQGPDLRWVGNESGFARDTEWNVLPFKGDPASGIRKIDAMASDLGSREKLAQAMADGAGFLTWLPPEVDVSIRPGWFYHASEDDQVKSLAQLMAIYFSSVGSNGLLLLNIPPDQRGRFADADILRLHEFGAELRRIFESGQCEPGILRPDPAGMVWTLELPEEMAFNIIGLQEDLSVGQRVEAFAVDIWDGSDWRQMVEGTTIGYKRLLRVAITKSRRARLRILASRLIPAIASIRAYLD